MTVYMRVAVVAVFREDKSRFQDSSKDENCMHGLIDRESATVHRRHFFAF